MLIRGELSRANKRKKKKKKWDGDERGDIGEYYFSVELPAEQTVQPTQATAHFHILGYPERGNHY